MITLEKLRSLREDQKAGKPLPVDWQEEVKKYLGGKHGMMETLRDSFENSKRRLEKIKYNIREAEAIYCLLVRDDVKKEVKEN